MMYTLLIKRKHYIMQRLRNTLPEEQRAKPVQTLKCRLADSIDLMLQTKQATGT